MQRIEFDNSKVLGRPNANLKNGATVHGAIEVYPDFTRMGFLSLDIRGPIKAYRGSAIIDRETARQVGVELLKWAFS